MARRAFWGRHPNLKSLLSLLLAVNLIAALALWPRAPLTPDDIPNPALPSPNAGDYYIAAGHLIVDRAEVDWWPKPPPPTAPAVTPPGLLPPTVAPPPKPVDKEALIDRNRPALAKLREGMAHPYMEPPCRSFSTLFPHYSKFRSLARLLRLESVVYEERGQWAAAMDSRIDAIYLGADVPHGAPLIGDLAGIAIAAIGRKDAWRLIEHLEAGEARAAAKRIESIQARRASFADVLTEEKWMTVASLAAIFDRPGWRTELLNTAGVCTPDPFQDFRLVTLNRRRTMRLVREYFDAMIERAHRPYVLQGEAPEVPDDPVCPMILSNHSKAGWKHTSAETADELLTVSLALQAYRAEHGEYPDGLAALVPNYLALLPDDPFAPAGTFRYRREGGNYVLYSLGPDGKDEGGRAIGNAERRRVLHDSVGDMVAGVN